MGFRRYVAPTAREALERIRKELGPDAVILSNRRAGPKLVEIIAAASGQMRALVEDFDVTDLAPVMPPARAAAGMAAAAPQRRPAPESFQEFIRRQTVAPVPRHEGLAMYGEVAAESGASAAPLAAARLSDKLLDATPVAVFRRRPSRQGADSAAPAPAAAAPAVTPAAAVPAPVAAPAAAPAAPPVAPAIAPAAAAAPAAAPPLAVAPAAPIPAAAATPAVAAALAGPATPLAPAAATAAAAPPSPVVPISLAAAPAPVCAPTPAPAPAPVLAAAAALVTPAPAPAAPAPLADTLGVFHGNAAVAALPDSRLMAELQSLRSALSDRISNLEVRLAAKAETTAAAAAPTRDTRPPARQQIMTRLIMSGFSPELARRVGDAAPAQLEPKGTDAWLQQVITQYVRCPA